MNPREEAEKMIRRYRPTYKLELYYRPYPDVPVGTEAILTMGENIREVVVYRGGWLWIRKELALWLDDDKLEIE